MAKIESMVVNTKYRIVFIPFATYKRVGEVSILTVLGMPVYRRVGDIRSLFGIGYHAS